MRISDWSSDVCSSDLPLMKAQGFGAVVNVSSIGGLLGVGSCMAYSASKGALNTMTMAMARSLGPEIRVNAVCPGFIASRRWEERPVGKGVARMCRSSWSTLHEKKKKNKGLNTT